MAFTWPARVVLHEVYVTACMAHEDGQEGVDAILADPADGVADGGADPGELARIITMGGEVLA